MSHAKPSHIITNAFLAVMMPVLLFAFGNLGDKATRRVAGFIARLMRCFAVGSKKLIAANIRTAFPEMDETAVKRMVADNMLHTVWNWLDFLRILKNPVNIKRFLSAADIPAPLPPQIILCLPHLGSWELVAQCAPHYFKKCAAVAEIFPYNALNNILERSRSINGLQIIPREGAAKGMLRAIREKTSVGILIDQNLSPRHGGIFVDFFGLPVPTSPLPAIIARRCHLPVLSGACIRQPDGRFKLLGKPVAMPDTDDPQRLTQAILAANEELIRTYPEQYTWLYKRWSCKPADTPPELAPRFPYYAIEKKYKLNSD